jgi:hypothetical protein
LRENATGRSALGIVRYRFAGIPYANRRNLKAFNQKKYSSLP